MSNTVETILKLENKLGESPIWHAARQKLYWVDLYAPALFECNVDGSNDRTRPLAAAAPIGSIVATTDPDHVIIALKTGLHLLNLDTLAMTLYCDPENGRSSIIANDLKVDRWGRMWLGTSHEKEIDPRGALWCVKDHNTWALADVGFPVSNGPAFSIDGRTMYFNDSVNRQTLAYDISPDHMRAENRRVFATFTEPEGVPDGATVDRNSDIWIAMWAGASLQRLSPGGKKLERIDVPAYQVTSVAFAGNNLDQLFITSARDGMSAQNLNTYPNSGSFFSYTPKTEGLPEPLFKLH
jgi:sugar lactone lactonase YvrE